MIDPMEELQPPVRLMLTPGPSNVSPRVYRALATPIVGHVDPWFTEFMGRVQELLRRSGRYGLATMCVGVGQGAALAFERV